MFLHQPDKGRAREAEHTRMGEGGGGGGEKTSKQKESWRRWKEGIISKDLRRRRRELLSQAEGGRERVETAWWRTSTEGHIAHQHQMFKKKQGFSKHEATCGSVQPVFGLRFSTSSWLSRAALQVKDPSPEAHLGPDEPV